MNLIWTVSQPPFYVVQWQGIGNELNFLLSKTPYAGLKVARSVVTYQKEEFYIILMLCVHL